MLEYLTCGYSHSSKNAGILSGFPSGVKVEKKYIEKQLKRRAESPLRSIRQKLETDSFEIISGLDYKNFTDGSPIGIILTNTVKTFKREQIIRPGHADLPAALKYSIEPWQARERASARETAVRTALFCFTMRLLEDLGIKISSKVISIDAEKPSVSLIEKLKKSKNSFGGIFEVKAENIPIGLGSHISAERRLSGKIFSALGSLNAVKGVEIGSGFSFAQKNSSIDEFENDKGFWKYLSNNSGGINAGIANGEPIVLKCAVRPLSGQRESLSSFDFKTRKKAESLSNTSDISCVYPAAVISEFILSYVLAQAIMEKFGGDSFKEISQRVYLWRKKSKKILRAA